MTSPTYSAGDAFGRRGTSGGGGLNFTSNGTGGGGSFASRHPTAGDDDPWEVGTIGEPGSAVYDMGAILFDVLSLPGTAGAGEDGRYGTEDDTDGIGPEDVFTWSIDDGTRQGRVVQMTMAGALSWLRNLAATSRDEYNYIARLLVESGYLSEGDVRYNSYTNDVAGAFLQSVIDVYFVNADEGAGATTTWFNHIDSLIEGAEASGTGVDGAGGGGGDIPEPPSRLDRFTDEMTVREAVAQAARTALGRSLTDAEEAAFVSQFRTLEQGWNDQQYEASLAQFEGRATSVTDAPNPLLAADNFVETAHQPEANAQSFGSYMGVLRRMVGLGGEGIGSNIA
jgi:hypothetical protein